MAPAAPPMKSLRVVMSSSLFPANLAGLSG
jgi:hypothetical protein